VEYGHSPPLIFLENLPWFDSDFSKSSKSANNFYFHSSSSKFEATPIKEESKNNNDEEFHEVYSYEIFIGNTIS